MRYDVDGNPIGHVDHILDGLELLPAAMRKPRLQALLTTWLKQVQEAEDAAWQLFTLRFLDNAFGATLDQWGEMVGEHRYTDGDDFYRVRIKVRIAVNTSRGNFTSLRRVALLALGHDNFRIWAHRKHVALHVFQPPNTAATRNHLIRWFTLAKVACDGFTLYRSNDLHPMIVRSVLDSVIAPDGVSSATGLVGGGSVMGAL